jgi:hypothetical protein
MEKIHGTSASVAWRGDHVWLSSGGESATRFATLFDTVALAAVFRELGYAEVTVYGEAYGGKQQQQAWRYGAALKFAAFDVQCDGRWLDVPSAEALVRKLGLEFVHYAVVNTDVATLDAERDAPSVQATRNGVDGTHPREGVVLRPLIEVIDAYGDRVIAKHKRDDERETATPRKVVDPSQLTVLADAAAIAEEWVTVTRLDHVLQKLPQGIGLAQTRDVIAAMVNDVIVEAKGEIVDSKEARAAIGKKAAAMFHTRIKKIEV